MKKAGICLSCFLLALLFFCSGFASKPVPGETPLRAEPNVTKIAEKEPNTTQSQYVSKTPESVSTSLPLPVERLNAICELIYHGKFDAADELIKQTSQYPQVTQLAKIVSEYNEINQKMRTAREAAYQQQLSELKKFQEMPSAIKSALTTSSETDTNDINDSNNISKVLSVITKACEFAQPKQKEELLSDAFVKQIIQKAGDKAKEFESKGKWLDAYVGCYSWLQVIDEDNREYSDHAEQLLEKADIVASFQDSPCETSSERFEGVKEQMFIKAIEVLNSNYVNPLDYRQMASKAVRRCQLLAEVMDLSFSEIQKNLKGSFTPPDSKKLANFSLSLKKISDEVDQSLTGLSKDKFIEVFNKVLELNAATAELPRLLLIAQFSEAALAALDPYTVMVWPRQTQEFEKIMTNEFTGIGIEITKEKGLLTVASLMPDTPAYNSGLDAGDVIEQVDGVATKDMTLVCAVRKITGPAGTKVALMIKRPGQEQTREIIITRAKITVQTIRGWQRVASWSGDLQGEVRQTGRWLYVIDECDKIGYVRIAPNFSDKTAADLEGVLTQLEAQGLKGLILDLRFNTGGLLNSAVEVTDKFLEKGPIVITRPRFWISSTYASARKENTHPGYPLVILINRFSASASEIVAGALADKVHNRAVLVGERTHGKGSVQGIALYPDEGAQLKYTMAYYHLPSGQRVESQEEMKKQGRKDWGVGPNIEVKLTMDELKKVNEIERDNAVLFSAEHDSGTAPPKKHTLEETLAADSQLAIGILVVKTKLIQAEVSKGKR